MAQPGKISYLPKEIVRSTATIPGDLCDVCRKIDIKRFFIPRGRGPMWKGDHNKRRYSSDDDDDVFSWMDQTRIGEPIYSKLGPFHDILRKERRCLFCHLIVAALKAVHHEGFSVEDNREIEIHRGISGICYAESGDEQHTYHIYVPNKRECVSQRTASLPI